MLIKTWLVGFWMREIHQWFFELRTADARDSCFPASQFADQLSSFLARSEQMKGVGFMLVEHPTHKPYAGRPREAFTAQVLSCRIQVVLQLCQFPLGMKGICIVPMFLT